MSIEHTTQNRNEDIYQYYFSSLYKMTQSLIGSSALHQAKSEEEKEIDEIVDRSQLLFDVTGTDFKQLTMREAEYRYWVEVYILKIIRALLDRYSIRFEEKYHENCNEQHSIQINSDGKLVESYFLFDLESERTGCTEYDIIAQTLVTQSPEVQAIDIYIFRNTITTFTLAGLVSASPEMNQNGFVRILPLSEFFNTFFSLEEYSTFLEYAKEFAQKCNNTISYRTIITPNANTLAVFKKRKIDMFQTLDYTAIASRISDDPISSYKFREIKNSFINRKMFLALVGNNDFADSFISAEWAYDVYLHAMGELELTGIIAGYLKSIEQLLFAIAKFYKNKGKKVKIDKKPAIEYTTETENQIDFTLWQLENFLSYAKIFLSPTISKYVVGCIGLWREHQRNGYFHKHNLFIKDNKISELRLQTLFLYFLILGGIEFTHEQELSLGIITNHTDMFETDCDFIYNSFKTWMNNIIQFDLHDNASGIWFNLSKDSEEKFASWTIQPYEMKSFYIEDFESGSIDDTYFANNVVQDHTHCFQSFTWNPGRICDTEIINSVMQLCERYSTDFPDKIDQMHAILLYSEKGTHILYSPEADGYYAQCKYRLSPDGDILDEES